MDPNEYHQSRDIQPVLGQVVKPTTLSGGGKVYLIHPARITNPEVEGADLQTEVDADVTIPVHFISTQGPNDGDFIVGIPLGPKLIASRKVGGLAHVKGRIVLDHPWILHASDPSSPNPFVAGWIQFLRAGAGKAQDLPRWVDYDYGLMGLNTQTYGWQSADGGIGGYTPPYPISLVWHNPTDPTEGVDYDFYQPAGTYDYWIQREPYGPVVKRNVVLDAGSEYDWGVDTMPLDVGRWPTTAWRYVRESCYMLTKPVPAGSMQVHETLPIDMETQVGKMSMIRNIGYDYDSMIWRLDWEESQGATEKMVYEYNFNPQQTAQGTPGRDATRFGIGEVYFSVRATKYVYDANHIGDPVSSFGPPPSGFSWHPHRYMYVNSLTGGYYTWIDDVQGEHFFNIFYDKWLLDRPIDWTFTMPTVPYYPTQGVGDVVDPFGGTVNVHVTQEWKGWPAQVRWETWHPA